jgi:TonB family protein
MLLLIAIVIAGSLAVFGQKVRREPVRYTVTGCRPAVVTGGILNDNALSLPKPVYSRVPKAARVEGVVVVQVRVDENGDVVSASAVSGNPLLRASAEAAARKAKFERFRLSEQPVIVGLLTYDFGPPKRKPKKGRSP